MILLDILHGIFDELIISSLFHSVIEKLCRIFLIKTMTFKLFVDLRRVCSSQMSPTDGLKGSARYISILDMFGTTDIHTQDRIHCPFLHLLFSQRILPGVIMNELNTVLLTLYQERFKRAEVLTDSMI